MDDKTINASASIPSVFNKKMVDAFMQTDKMNGNVGNGCDINDILGVGVGVGMGQGGGVGGLEKGNHTLKQILEMEAVMKQIQNMCGLMNGVSVGGGRVGVDGGRSWNGMCGGGNVMPGICKGGIGFSILPMMFNYFIVNILLILVCCVLAYVFYLKFNNGCCSKECCFSRDKNIFLQMKRDVVLYLKKMMFCLLNKSVKVVHGMFKAFGICNDVYRTCVDEFIKSVEVCCEEDCGVGEKGCGVGEKGCGVEGKGDN